VLPDLVAWLFLVVEGQLRPGCRVSGDGFQGRVQRVGFRALVVLDDSGQQLTVPNRVLIRSPYRYDEGPWALAEVEIRLPIEVAEEEVHRAIREAVLLAPWVAPGAPEVSVVAIGDGAWTVRARLLDGTHRPAFEGAIRRRVLAAWSTPTGTPSRG